MFLRFCPSIRGICRDGFPQIEANSKEHADEPRLLCSFWDTMEAECTFAKAALIQCDNHRTIRARLQAIAEGTDAHQVLRQR